MDSLDGREYDLDVVTQVPHAAVRIYVMGERAVRHEQASPEERVEMGRIASAGIKAGALGISTSRTINHLTLAGEHTPTLRAAEEGRRKRTNSTTPTTSLRAHTAPTNAWVHATHT